MAVAVVVDQGDEGAAVAVVEEAALVLVELGVEIGADVFGIFQGGGAGGGGVRGAVGNLYGHPGAAQVDGGAGLVRPGDDREALPGLKQVHKDSVLVGGLVGQGGVQVV